MDFRAVQRHRCQGESRDIEEFSDQFFQPLRLCSGDSDIARPLLRRQVRILFQKHQISHYTCQRRLEIVGQIHDQVVFLLLVFQDPPLIQNRLKSHFVELILRFLHHCREHDRLLFIRGQLRRRVQKIIKVAKRFLQKPDRVQKPDHHRQPKPDQEKSDPGKLDSSAAVRPDPVPQVIHIPVQPNDHQNHIDRRMDQILDRQMPAQADAECRRRPPYFAS